MRDETVQHRQQPLFEMPVAEGVNWRSFLSQTQRSAAQHSSSEGLSQALSA